MMVSMKRGVIFIPFLLILGCYDLDAGSKAVLLDELMAKDSQNSVNCGDDPCPNWDQCEPGGEVFFDMQTGHPCDFGGSCGFFGVSTEDENLLAREAGCINGIVTVTEAEYIDSAEAVDETVVWEDCEVMDGELGEACEGSFTCFRPASDNCLEKVVCGSGYEGGDLDRLYRYLVCDDVSPDATPSPSGTYTSCEGLIDAHPLDACIGTFLCSFVTADADPELVPCDDVTNVFSYLGDMAGTRIAWCDGTQLHFAQAIFGIPYLIDDAMAYAALSDGE